MQTLRWYRLLTVCVVAAPIASLAQTPQPRVRELATMPGIEIREAVRMPNGRVILYATYDSVTGSIFAYDVASKRSTLVTRGFDGNLSLSRAGDRIAYDHESEDRKDDFIWSIPIDPTTGAAAGPAQRVTMGKGNTPSISPDGKLIAFEGHRSSTRSDLAVVPTVGGPERVVAEYDKGIGGMSWSADGKWIFVRVGGRRDTSASIQRVPAAGGRSESVMSFGTPDADTWVTDGGQIALYWKYIRAQWDGHMAYMMRSGRQGEFRIPAGSVSGNYTDVGSARSLLRKTSRPTSAHLLNLVDGSMRDLLPGARQSRAPVWSPDGRRLAVQDSTGHTSAITVMNADGSQPRRYPVALDPNTPDMHWSPNSRMLAYYAQGDSMTLAVLDVETGSSRIVSSGGPYGANRDFTWRPDGQSIVVVKHSVPSDYTHGEVYEVPLNGIERKLRDIGAEFPAWGVGGFVSDRLLVAGTQFAAELSVALIPTSSGPLQILPGGARVGHAWPGASHDGKWILWLARNPAGRLANLEIMSTGGDSLRTLSLPIEISSTKHVPFQPDDQHVILFGRTPGDQAFKVFLVPLAGGVPRVLATLPGRPYDGRLDLSPDGKSLVFTTEGAPTSTIYELDLTPIIPAVRKP